jgi:hypothetical protein
MPFDWGIIADTDGLRKLPHAGTTSWNHFKAQDGTALEILSRADEDS